MLNTLLIVASGFVTAFLAVGGARRYALARSILDLPNQRSSHTVPTPRGGGAGLVVPFVGLVALFVARTEPITPELVLALTGVLAVAAIGWLDDWRGVGVSVRLLVHIAAGSALIPLVLSGDLSAWLVPVAAAVCVFVAVSAVNVVNFMDGIDGLVGSQVLLFGIHLVVLSSPESVSYVWGLLLAATCAGFLAWNWPPARIFMGDAGSGALGIAAVAGGLLVLRTTSIHPFAVFLPLYPLVMDAATTLMRRVIRKERIWEAHRTHLYQRLANGGWGHRRVTVLYGVAAAVAVAVVGLRTVAGWPLIVTAYGLAVLAVGAMLSGTRPRSRSPGRERTRTSTSGAK